MNSKAIAKTVLYGFASVTTVFLAHTVGFTAEKWKALDWFQLLTIALQMNAQAILIIIALFDSPNESPKGLSEKIGGAPAGDLADK